MCVNLNIRESLNKDKNIIIFVKIIIFFSILSKYI